MGTIHRFFIFNRPVESNGVRAFGIITSGKTECECLYECQTKLKTLICNKVWQDGFSKYTTQWCQQNHAKQIRKDDEFMPNGEWSYLSENGKIYRTIDGECPPEFFYDFCFEGSGYSFALIHSYIPYVTDCDGKLFINEDKYYDELVNMNGLKWDEVGQDLFPF